MDEFLSQKLGRQVHDAVMQEMGSPIFLPGQSYPDQVLRQMADLAAENTGKSSRDIMRDFGLFTVPKFKQMYKRYFKGDTLKEFLLTMNQTHANLTKDMPGIKPPRFSYDDKGKTLIMTYHSSRGYGDYFEGILKGAAEHFGQSISVKTSNVDKETTRAEIQFS